MNLNTWESLWGCQKWGRQNPKEEEATEKWVKICSHVFCPPFTKERDYTEAKNTLELWQCHRTKTKGETWSIQNEVARRRRTLKPNAHLVFPTKISTEFSNYLIHKTKKPNRETEEFRKTKKVRSHGAGRKRENFSIFFIDIL